jgi:TetR/AcrR family tetracycline transcriptional repressor
VADRTGSGKRRLSRDAVIEGALGVAYTQGLEGLTIRRLADQLSVSPMAIYWHVKNKDELIGAMGDRVCRDLELTANPADPWDEQLRTLLTDFMRALARYPGAASIVMPRMLYCDNGRRLMELALGLLRSAGFTVQESTQLARHGVRVVIGLITEPLFTEAVIEPERRDHVMGEYETIRVNLPADRYPNILAACSDLSDLTAQETFIKLGIDTYIYGVAAMANKPGSR